MYDYDLCLMYSDLAMLVGMFYRKLVMTWTFLHIHGFTKIYAATPRACSTHKDTKQIYFYSLCKMDRKW